MRRQFRLIKQYPKKKDIGVGIFVLDKKTEESTFFEGEGGSDGLNSQLFASMQRTKIEFAAANGIMLSGIERINNRYIYQEWWLLYI